MGELVRYDIDSIGASACAEWQALLQPFRRPARFALVCALTLSVGLTGCATRGDLEKGDAAPSTSATISAAPTGADVVPFDDTTALEDCDDATLDIHYINVGQAGATLIRGPSGTTVLYDVGAYDDGETIAAYLDANDIPPERGIDYVMVSHRHTDHFGGYGGLLAQNYDVRIANIDSFSTPPSATSRPNTSWWKKAMNTTAGRPRGAKPGEAIDLGCGARIIVAASNGYLIGGGRVVPVDENDRSISLLIERGDFSMTLDGDLGSGTDECSGSETPQKPVQQRVMAALIAQGFVDADFGVDVMHVAHHGSESSTSPAYYNLAKPELALISVGIDGGNDEYGHPRQRVVDSVLLGPERPACVTAPAVVACLQTEDGLADPNVPVQRKTSNECQSSGNIVVRVDASGDYTVEGDDAVAAGTDAEFGGGLLTFEADERAQAVPFDDSALTLAGKAFFDDEDNPVRMTDGSLVDISPPAPTLTDFDRALVGLCGAFASPLPGLDESLRAALLEHPDSIEDIRARLTQAGVPMGEGSVIVTELVDLWTAQGGFEHVFCGQRGSGGKIGGLHFVGRYLDLQERGQAWIAEGVAGGVFESDGAAVMSMPVHAQCAPKLCYGPLKGYQLNWHAEDQFVEGTLAWYFGAKQGGTGACLHEAEDGTSAVFAYRDGGIRTLYPDATPASDLVACRSADVLPASASSENLFDDDEDDCGD